MQDQPASRVLIVDDNRDHREALARAFAKAGYEVALAPTGEEALGLLAQARVDLVITDMRMPRMDGLELLRHVKLRWPTVQVVILTAFGDSISYMEAMESGAFRFLNKPVRRADILALAGTAVQKARTLESVVHGGPDNGESPDPS